jgi:plasmid stability protein
MYTDEMGRPLQVRDVPDDVLDVLKRRAAREGASLSSYALKLLSWHASHADLSEFADWPAITERPIGRDDIVDAIRQGREERTRQIDEAVSPKRGGR